MIPGRIGRWYTIIDWWTFLKIKNEVGTTQSAKETNKQKFEEGDEGEEENEIKLR